MYPGFGFNAVVAEYQYENMGRLSNVVLDGGNTGYGYDLIGRLDNQTISTAGFSNATSLDYNPASQITRRTVTEDLLQTSMPLSCSAAYSPNNLNQYASVDGSSLSYDLKGNLQSYEGWTYVYDAHNWLTSASKPGTSLSLSYDPTGRLNNTTLDGVFTEYVYSGNQLIAEYNASGVAQMLYVYAPGANVPVARINPSTGLSAMQFLRTDERGSVVALTDSVGLIETYQYDTYGEPVAPPGPNDSLFKYTGQLVLRGTDLYHYKARAYHPGLGRFMQTDPIGYDDGMNMYAYVGNDPMNFNDPTGTIACGGACIAAGVALAYRGYKAYKAYKAIKKARQVAAVASAIGEAMGEDVDLGDYHPEAWEDVVYDDPEAEGPYKRVDFDPDHEPEGDNQDKDNNKQHKKENNKKKGGGSEHRKNKRKSNKEKHQKGQARVRRDRDGEKKDARMKFRRD